MYNGEYSDRLPRSSNALCIGVEFYLFVHGAPSTDPSIGASPLQEPLLTLSSRNRENVEAVEAFHACMEKR